MLKYIRTNKNNTRGLYGIYGLFKVGSERLIIHDMGAFTAGFLIDYRIEESNELKSYIKYFAQSQGYDYTFILSFIKHLPIRRKDA